MTAAPSLCFAAPAISQELDTRLDERRDDLRHERERKEVLSTDLARYGTDLDQLAGEVATLRSREAIVEVQLARVETRLENEEARLVQLKTQLRRSLNVLRGRLVDVYRSGSPDLISVLLNSDGFDDLLSRYEYLRRIEEQDSDIVSRVRRLRNGTRLRVERITVDRNRIRAKRAELARTRAQLEARESELEMVRDQRQSALGRVRNRIDKTEEAVEHLQDKIQAQIQAASKSSTPALPAGPVQAAASGCIWPVDGVLTSPFGPRWGRMHEGIDIAAPGGTPIRAAKPGRTILAAYTGGYGNYTCVDHGGGLSTCYAHQSGYATSVGEEVGQGDVIGFFGNTGASFGDHLHFEIRVNGDAVDPLGYL